VRGFIPTGWYPTAARALADGKLAILNGKGLRSYANSKGPNPSQYPAPRHEGVIAEAYVGKIQTGTVSFLPVPTDAQLEAYSHTVLAKLTVQRHDAR